MRRLLPVLLTTSVIGLWADPASAQCPAAIPAPADPFHVQCFTINKPVDVRCATFITPSDCLAFNQQALNAGLLTAAGYNYLDSINFCAIVLALPGQGPRIFDFCPEGCFAADTQILRGMSSVAGPDYAAASSLQHRGSVMSLSDSASFDDVSLTQQAIKRLVVGPEQQDLFVFALANGRTLRVTMHHPMVLADGQIIEARKVLPDMSFIGLDGRSVAITKISREAPTADVFNFETGGDTDMSHIVVAEGVLTGDLKIQNALSDEQGAIDLRR